MSKELFTSWNPSSKSMDLVQHSNEIINEYLSQGYTLTLRQLYYQFVSRDLIENTERSYKNLGSVITKGRLAGLISWSAIEDRTRIHKSFWTDENILNPIKDLPHYIRFDQWARQEHYVEVWVEKEALGNVISRACNRYLVPHLSCKGYLSASAAYEAGKRFERKRNEGKICTLIHLGDHDPSGIDMTRDNDERVNLLSNFSDVEIKRIALNINQVEEFNPPPNPAKLSDTRAKKYIKKFGRVSWELDALQPKYIESLITTEIESRLDFSTWDTIEEEENEKKNKLRKIYKNWNKVSKFLNKL